MTWTCDCLYIEIELLPKVGLDFVEGLVPWSRKISTSRSFPCSTTPADPTLQKRVQWLICPFEPKLAQLPMLFKVVEGC